MMGRRPPLQRELFCYASEVPRTRLAERTQALQEAFDWEAVRARAQAYFDPTVGRPSLDPVVVVKLLLLHKLTGCRSWRGLVELASDSMACREFLGYAWSESLPSHQALCDWRQRLGPEFLEDLLVDIVRHCQREGMVLSSVRVVDATGVKAQADLAGPTVTLDPELSEAEAWLAAAGLGGEGEDEPPPKGGGRGLAPVCEQAPKKRTKLAPPVVNLHDPEARVSRKPGQPRAFRYQVSCCTDPHSQLVVSTLVKGTEEPGTALEHVDQDPGQVAILVADQHYDTTAVHVGLVERGVKAVICRQDRQRGHGYAREQFEYHVVGDFYRCPAGAELHRVNATASGDRKYRGSAAACGSCAQRCWCTESEVRHMTVQADAAARDGAVRGGREYRALQTLRRMAEHIWRVGKRDLGLERADGLGLAQMRISAALVAVCINLGKLLAWRAAGPAPGVLAAALDPDGPEATVALSWAA